MKLELYDEDLKPGIQMLSAEQATFDKFNEAAQKAILAVGKAAYCVTNHPNFSCINFIYSPEVRETPGPPAEELTEKQRADISGCETGM
jgi:hypothetical protein